MAKITSTSYVNRTLTVQSVDFLTLGIVYGFQALI